MKATREDLHISGRPLTQEEFIEKIKTDAKFADKWSDLGKVYGYQWRHWNGEIDQIENLINELRNNPDSRRMLVSAWNPSDLPDQVLPPCHYGFQVWTRELSAEERMDHWFKKKKPNRDVCDFVDTLPEDEQHEHFDNAFVPKRAISLMWSQRSVDVGLGLGFNIASYGALLTMLADELQMIPDELIGSLGDCHIYLNHIEGLKEQLTREPFPLPTLSVRDGIYSRHVDDFFLENYQSHPKIFLPLSN